MENKGGATSHWEGDADNGASGYKIVRIKVIEEGETKETNMNQDPNAKEDGSIAYAGINKYAKAC